MDGDIQAHEVNEGLVIAKAKQGGKIVGVIFSGVDSGELSLAKDVAVNSSCNIWELSDPRISLLAGDGNGKQIKFPTGPWSLQKRVPSSPSSRCLGSKLLRRQSRGSTTIKVIREGRNNRQGENLRQ